MKDAIQIYLLSNRSVDFFSVDELVIKTTSFAANEIFGYIRCLRVAVIVENDEELEQLWVAAELPELERPELEPLELLEISVEILRHSWQRTAAEPRAPTSSLWVSPRESSDSLQASPQASHRKFLAIF